MKYLVDQFLVNHTEMVDYGAKKGQPGTLSAN